MLLTRLKRSMNEIKQRSLMKDGDVECFRVNCFKIRRFFANKLKERMKMVNVFTAEKKRLKIFD